MKDVAYAVGTSVAVIVVLLFGFKGCALKLWVAPSAPTTYAAHGSDGRSLAVMFLPKHQTIVLYSDKNTEFKEAALTHMRGHFGTHYI